MSAIRKLKDLAARAEAWLGRAAAPAAHTAAIAGDKFDDMIWAEVTAQSGALRELAAELHQHHDYAPDLVRDVFLAAYKTDPQLRDPASMDPSRMVNHRIVASLLTAPEFTELRRYTTGHQYEAAMAVLAQAGNLRAMTAKARQAQESAQSAAAARHDAHAAAQAVQDALAAARDQAGADGSVPDDAARAVSQAITRAEETSRAEAEAGREAGQALEAAAPQISSAARQAAATAAAQAKDEAALMASWGVDPGTLQRMPFAQRRALADRLRSTRLGKFAGLIGRFRIMSQGERARKVEHAPGELTRITLSDDLARLIPSEMAALGIPQMRAPFWARFAEKRLATYDTRGSERAGRGAIIAVIDSSDSMSDAAKAGLSREAWSKALALALLDHAQAGRRDFAAILFGSRSELREFKFPAGRKASINDVLDLAEFFFAGGTDFETPLTAAAELLQAEYNQAGRMRGDIVFVTDGECGVSDTWQQAWRDARTRLGFRVYGIALSRRPGPVMTAICDNVRGLDDLAAPGGTRDIFRLT